MELDTMAELSFRVYRVLILSGLVAIQVCFSSDSFKFWPVVSFSEVPYFPVDNARGIQWNIFR
jgi:hypothetical protein